jgi:cobalt-zinc-cadmium efflux system protein
MSGVVRLTVAVLLNVGVVLVELWFSHLSGSLSLASDALHNLQDVFALLVSLVALYLSRRKPTGVSTYGYVRAEPFGAFVGSILLVLSVLYVGYEAVKSLIVGHSEVAGTYVLTVGAVAFIVNTASAYILHGRGDLNIRSAYLHLVGDAAFSLAVVVGGSVMALTGWTAVDSILTLLFVPFLLKDGVAILVRSVRILMEFAPEGYDSSTVARVIGSVDGVREVHDVHVWAISSKEPSVSAHVVLNGDLNSEEISRILKEIEGRLKDMGIKHTTLQVEPDGYRCEGACR